MHELKMKVAPICEMKDKLVSWSKSELEKGREHVDTKEMGEAIDMIKDLAEAEEKMYKAAYYCSIVKAMEEYDEEENERMGYDHWRTSSGRYAPNGTGHWTPIHGRKGYPMPAEGDWRPDYGVWGDGRDGHMMDAPRMGYTDPDYAKIMHDERHGEPYRRWKLARKHYTETKSDGDKHEMTEHAKEHMADTVTTIKEIWMAADPDLRAKMKNDLTTLMADMK